MKSIRQNWLRLVMAALAGVAVAGISVVVAWRQTRDYSIVAIQQYGTQQRLGEIGKAISAYKQKFNEDPKTMEQLRALTNQFSYLEYGFREGFLDTWQRPFITTNDGTSLVVMSYGRDGKPGGLGLDYDISTKKLKPPEANVTLSQFISDSRTTHFLIVCITSGIITSAMCLFMTKRTGETTDGLIPNLLRFCATFIGALIIALMITALHVPSGH